MPLTNDEIDRRIEEYSLGDSNDREIDGLLEIIRTLQAERALLDQGEILLVTTAAFSWASYLRDSAADKKQDRTKAKRYREKADEIDVAASNIRNAQHENALAAMS